VDDENRFHCIGQTRSNVSEMVEYSEADGSASCIHSASTCSTGKPLSSLRLPLVPQLHVPILRKHLVKKVCNLAHGRHDRLLRRNGSYWKVLRTKCGF